MKTAILTGIDGCGKSTLVRQLYEEYGTDPAIGIVACPSYHHIPGSGKERLSLLLEKLNELGNRHRVSDLKALALYLQMSLYSPVLQKISADPCCTLVISERHALIDTVVYGSMYAKKITGSIDKQTWQPVIEKELNVIYPGGFDEIQEWIVYLDRSTGGQHDFWNYTGFLKNLFTTSPRRIIAVLSDFFHLQLPDQVCFLAIEPDTAIARLQKRDKQLELHERTDILQALQRTYLQLLDILTCISPAMDITILNESDYCQVKNCLHLTSINLNHETQ